MLKLSSKMFQFGFKWIFYYKKNSIFCYKDYIKCKTKEKDYCCTKVLDGWKPKVEQIKLRFLQHKEHRMKEKIFFIYKSRNKKQSNLCLKKQVAFYAFMYLTRKNFATALKESLFFKSNLFIYITVLRIFLKGAKYLSFVLRQKHPFSVFFLLQAFL